MSEKSSINKSGDVKRMMISGGEMSKRIRRLDWSKTPLGAIENWQQSLKTAVQIMLDSRYPMFVW